MILRDNTQDIQTIAEMFAFNDYGVPKQFDDGAVVVDVGANIGAFTIRCLQAGASKVHCYEPDPGNYAIMEFNLLPYHGLTTSTNVAVWRSDIPPQQLHMRHHGRLSAQHHCFGSAGDPLVWTEGLDSILGRHGEVDLLKLDCEGSEFPILFTSRRLGLCKRIELEVHEQFSFQDADWDCTAQGLMNYLIATGFSVTKDPHRECQAMWFLHAERI